MYVCMGTNGIILRPWWRCVDSAPAVSWPPPAWLDFQTVWLKHDPRGSQPPLASLPSLSACCEGDLMLQNDGKNPPNSSVHLNYDYPFNILPSISGPYGLVFFTECTYSFAACFSHLTFSPSLSCRSATSRLCVFGGPSICAGSMMLYRVD